MRWIKASARIIYEPIRTDLRKQERNTPWWTIAQLTGKNVEDFSDYYRWILRCRGIGFISQPAWKPHITILDGRHSVKDKFLPYWKKRNGEIVEFEYNPDIQKVWKFWVLPVRCSKFDLIRKELGFHEEYPYHITIGREYELPKKE